MEIINVGYNYCHPPGFYIDRPLGTGDYILLIIRSEAFAVLQGERLAVPKNSALIFKKGTPQLYGSCGSEYINDWIHFEIDAAEEREFSDLGVPFDSVIPLGAAMELSLLIKSLFIEKYSQNFHKAESMKRYFDLILLKLSESVYRLDPQREHPLYHSFCTLRGEMQLLPQSDWSIDEICKKMNLSRSYTQHLYKQFFGISITADLQSNRIAYAKYLLSSTNMKISAICHACGYENDVHFMRVFKKSASMTPSEYRKHFRISPAEVEKSQSRHPFDI